MSSGFSPAQMAQIRVMVESGYIPTIEAMARRLSAPLWWDVNEGAAQRRRQGAITPYTRPTPIEIPIPIAGAGTEG